MFSFMKNIADFFLPRLCPSCENKLLPEEKTVCGKCISSIVFINEKKLADEFRQKFSGKNIISGIVSLMLFEKDFPSQHILHAIKYRGMFSLGRSMGCLLGEMKRDMITGWGADVIVPVPLHRLKRSARGYNQSHYIAAGLSRELGIPIETKAVKRIKYTETQTRMSIAARIENMDNAFSLTKKNFVRGRTIILVDDVVTTGATLNSCGGVLIRGGAEKVYAVSLAIV